MSNYFSISIHNHAYALHTRIYKYKIQKLSSDHLSILVRQIKTHMAIDNVRSQIRHARRHQIRRLLS